MASSTSPDRQPSDATPEPGVVAARRAAAPPAPSRTTKIALFVVLPLAVVGVLDYVAPKELSMSFFYLVPVAFATVLAGRKGGVICSLAASAMFCFIEIAGNASLGMTLWNSLMRLGILLALVLLLPPMVEKVADSLSDDR